jgi:NAD(P)-dependent dehydrogenase (short-subunit alcohol dehydrogenase family)
MQIPLKFHSRAYRIQSTVLPVLQKINKINNKIPTSFFYIDLASLASVGKAVTEINRNLERIDYLINNAGILEIPELKKSEDGIEM